MSEMSETLAELYERVTGALENKPTVEEAAAYLADLGIPLPMLATLKVVLRLGDEDPGLDLLGLIHHDLASRVPTGVHTIVCARNATLTVISDEQLAEIGLRRAVQPSPAPDTTAEPVTSRGRVSSSTRPFRWASTKGAR